MTPSLQAQWSWMRMCREQWRSPGIPLQMRRKMTGCTTWSPSVILSSVLGKLWQTVSSITNSPPLISCLEGSISSGSTPRMTWGFRSRLNHQPGKWREEKAGLKTKKKDLKLCRMELKRLDHYSISWTAEQLKIKN